MPPQSPGTSTSPLLDGAVWDRTASYDFPRVFGLCTPPVIQRRSATGPGPFAETRLPPEQAQPLMDLFFRSFDDAAYAEKPAEIKQACRTMCAAFLQLMGNPPDNKWSLPDGFRGAMWSAARIGTYVDQLIAPGSPSSPDS